VHLSLKDSNKERKTSRLPGQLCRMTERREREKACFQLHRGGELRISGTYPTSCGSLGRAWFLQGEMTAQAWSGTWVWGGCQRALSGCYEVHLQGTRPARGSRWCLAAIDGHVHVVLTLKF